MFWVSQTPQFRRSHSCPISVIVQTNSHNLRYCAKSSRTISSHSPKSFVQSQIIATRPFPPDSTTLIPPHPNALLHIKTPLTNHPHQAAISHKNRPSETLSPSRRPKNPPLAHEMRPSNGIRQHSHLIDLRVRNVVGSVDAHEGLHDTPGSEGARGETGCGGAGAWVGFCWFVGFWGGT